MSPLADQLGDEPASAPVPQDGSNARPQSPATICDWCRSRKVKCLPLDQDKFALAQRADLLPTCQRCFRHRTTCRFSYVLKKPGRPRGRSNTTSQVQPVTSTDGLSAFAPSSVPPAASPSTFSWDGAIPSVPPHPAEPFDAPGLTADSINMLNHGPDLSSLFGSAKGALSAQASRDGDHGQWDSLLARLLQTPAPSPPPEPAPLPPSARHSFHRNSQPSLASASGQLGASWNGPTPSERSPLTEARLSMSAVPASMTDGSAMALPYPIQTSPGQSTSHHPSQSFAGMSDAGGPSFAANVTGNPLSPPELAPWSDVCFFVSLFVKHQHALVPLVHRPTFANDMLHRRDERDDQFRALLASIVAYTICQVPVNLMIGRYTRNQLEDLMQGARRMSRAIQLASTNRPTLTLLTSVILDCISNAAAGDPVLTDMLLHEARRLTYALKLHSSGGHAELSFRDGQVSRILFWEYWAVEKTAALDGHPIMLHTLEGVPPLPLELDDDYISAGGGGAQPQTRPSYMTGFIAVTRIHRILGDCICRHRLALNHQADDEPVDVAGAVRWVDRAVRTLHEIVEGAPPATESDDQLQALGDDDPQWWLGTQVANIRITALAAEFALLDYRAVLSPAEDIKRERQTTAKRAYETLSSMPVVYLASNGESMRGKVLRIIMSLLAVTSESEDLGEHVWEWWNMYSKIQFLQVIPQVTEPAERPT